jgi:hypothetical protein
LEIERVLLAATSVVAASFDRKRRAVRARGESFHMEIKMNAADGLKRCRIDQFSDAGAPRREDDSAGIARSARCAYRPANGLIEM